jgi:hypothetical protein
MSSIITEIRAFKSSALLLFLIPVFFYSCYPNLYTSTQLNVPLYHGDHEFEVSGSLHDLQVSAPLFWHFGIALDANLRKNWYSHEIGNEYIYNKDAGSESYEGGLVFFISNKEKNVIYSATGGYGSGSGRSGYYEKDHYGTLITRKLYSDFQKVYFQTDIGFLSKVFDFSIDLRYSYLNFKNLSFDKTIVQIKRSETTRYPIKNYFIEPAFTMRYNMKYTSFYYQMEYSYANDFVNKTIEIAPYKSRFVQSFGLQINFGKWIYDTDHGVLK